MPDKDRPCRLAQLAQRGCAIVSAFDAAMTRRVKGHVVVPPP